MIRFVNMLVLLLLVTAMGSSAAQAKTIRKQVKFYVPVVVNGTLVKSGTYDAVFDDQSNELSIVRDGKVVAQSPAEVEKRVPQDKASYVTREDGDSTNAVLVSVTLKNGNQATIVNSANKAGGQ